MSELQKLPGIGPYLSSRLTEAGITSAEQLREAGVKDAFLRVRALYPDLCMMSLYAMAGAVSGKPRGALTDGEKKELRAFFHSL